MNGAITSTSHSSAAFYAMQTDLPTKSEHLQPYLAALSADGPVTTIPLPHFVHTVHAGWLARAAQPSPTLPLTVLLDRGAYSTLSLPMPTTSLKTPRVKSLTCCADSGAQLTTVPMSILAHLRLPPSSLFPIATNLNTVTGASVDLLGGIFLEFSGTNPCGRQYIVVQSSTQQHRAITHL